MKKKINIKLQEDYAGHVLHDALLMRIRTKTGQLFGFTNVDFPIDYDAAPYVDTDDESIPGDDFGMLTHVSDNGGFSMSKTELAANLAVNNAELQLVPNDDTLTPEKLLAGLFESAEVYIYRVNYLDLSRGHELVNYGYGDTVRVSDNVTFTAFRSMSDKLKEPEVELWSKTCPHTFGGPKCPKDFVWVAGEVTAVDLDEPTRLFGTDITGLDDDFYRFGMVKWKTGDNAGKECELDQNTGNTFGTMLDMEFAAQVGDTFDVRQDCSKVYDDDKWGCLYHWGEEERNLWYGGCPDIPSGDGGTSMVPGAGMERHDD